ncbi:MAG: 2-C-methyl-D-erythritol 2,4-cyclodiphosphate synthase [Pseudomonadales bacterium]
MRIGQGIDVHAFSEPGSASHIMLGGVEIPHDRGVVAHSDGDVLIHALMDALLGALGLPDIGHQFPDSDPQFSGANSMKLLASVVGRMNEAELYIENLDATVLLEMPKLAAHREAMIQSISQALGCDQGRVGLKATTTEKLGFIGRGEGISAQVVVLLTSDPK